MTAGEEAMQPTESPNPDSFSDRFFIIQRKIQRTSFAKEDLAQKWGRYGRWIGVGDGLLVGVAFTVIRLFRALGFSGSGIGPGGIHLDVEFAIITFDVFLMATLIGCLFGGAHREFGCTIYSVHQANLRSCVLGRGTL
jgi:hypothetical protein